MGNSYAENVTWPKVAIIILNWNSWRDTIECLESLEKIKYPNYKVVLIDNGSVDDSVLRISEWLAKRSQHWGTVDSLSRKLANSFTPTAQLFLKTDRLFLICLPENLGFTGGCNLGIEYILDRDPAVDFVFLLNNDALVDPNCLTECVITARKQNAAITGAVVKHMDNPRLKGAGARFPLELFIHTELSHSDVTESWPADAVSGATMLIRRDILENRKRKLGYFFDPSLFMYGEELELCTWSKINAYTIIVAGTATVRHKLTVASGGSHSPLSYYYVTRNRVYLARRLLSPQLKVLFHLWYPFSRLLRVLFAAVQGKWQIVVAIVEGLLDGYRGVTGKWKRHPVLVKVDISCRK